MSLFNKRRKKLISFFERLPKRKPKKRVKVICRPIVQHKKRDSLLAKGQSEGERRAFLRAIVILRRGEKKRDNWIKLEKSDLQGKGI